MRIIREGLNRKTRGHDLMVQREVRRGIVRRGGTRRRINSLRRFCVEFVQSEQRRVPDRSGGFVPSWGRAAGRDGSRCFGTFGGGAR